MASQATQQDIESWLWEAANILRGPVDPANLRDFVFPLHLDQIQIVGLPPEGEIFDNAYNYIRENY